MTDFDTIVICGDGDAVEVSTSDVRRSDLLHRALRMLELHVCGEAGLPSDLIRQMVGKRSHR